MTNIDAPILLKTLKGPHTPTLSITHASHSAAQSITSIANTVQENIYGATENEALPNGQNQPENYEIDHGWDRPPRLERGRKERKSKYLCVPFLPLMWMPFFWLRIHYIHLEDYVDFKTTCARTRNVTISYGCKIWLPEWLEGKLIVKKPRLLERLKIWDVTRVEPAPRDGTQMIVVGLLPTGQDRDFNVLVPKEVCWTFGNEMNVLLALKKSAFRLRGMKNWFSFKHVGRLGVYRCNIEAGDHTRLMPRPQQIFMLRELYHAYRKSNWEDIPMDKWNHWVTTQISEKGLSIELVLEWSKVRVGFAVAVSIAMSLVGGFAYQFTTGDTQTAWTIGGYMMTVYGFVIGYAAWVSTVETR